MANRLSDEHKQLKVITRKLDEMVDMVLLDVIVPKALFIEKLALFIKKQHLDYEEQDILPAIKNTGRLGEFESTMGIS